MESNWHVVQTPRQASNSGEAEFQQAKKNTPCCVKKHRIGLRCCAAQVVYVQKETSARYKWFGGGKDRDMYGVVSVASQKAHWII